MRRLLFAVALLLWALPAEAQICPTVSPASTADNRCASTAFVQGAISLGVPITVGTTVIVGGTSGRVIYDNAGVIGEYAITGAGSVVLGTSPTITTPSISSPALSGTVTGNNTIPLGILSQSAANTMLGNWTGSTADVSANAMPSCPDSGGNHLNYVSGTGVTCGTGIGSGITALTGDVTATGPGSVPATLATAQPGAHTWAAIQTFTLAPVFTDQSGSRTALGLGTAATQNTGTSGATIPFLNGTNTWSGANAFNAGASVDGLTVTSSFTATGLVTNAALANPATTVNGQTCTLGSTCTVTAAATTITVGSTAVASGTTARILYDNAGTLGEYTLTGTGTVVAMQTSPSLTTPNINVATGTSLALAGCTIGGNALCATGTGAISGALTLGAVSGTDGTIVLNGSTSGTGTIRVAAAAGTATIFQIPATNGTSGYVLQTDGSGITSWVNPSSGGTVTSVTCNGGLTGGVITTSGTCAVDIASAANFEAGTANKILDAAGVFTAETTTTYGTTTVLDFNTFVNTRVTLTGNITTLTCSNMKASQSGTITFVQDGTGTRTMVAGWCSVFRWVGGSRGVLSTAINAVDALFYTCVSTAVCYVSLGKAQAN